MRTYLRFGGWFLALLIMLAAALLNLPVAARSPLLASAQSNPTVLGVVSVDSSALYATPNGDVMQRLASGAIVNAFGRSEDNAWVAVLPENGAAGWIQAKVLVLFGLEQLPVLDPSQPLAAPSSAAHQSAQPTAAPPTATPTPSPTPSPTPTPAPPTATPLPTQAPSAATGSTSTQSAGRSSSPAAAAAAIVRQQGAALQDKPAGAQLQTLSIGDAINVNGRSDDSQWLYVTLDSGVSGWMAVDDLVIFDTASLPVTSPNMAGQLAPASTAQNASAEQTVDSTTNATTNTTTNATANTQDKTATTQVAPTAAAANAETNKPAQGVSVVVQTPGSRLNVRAGPGMQFGIIDKANNGASLLAIARNADSTWVQVTLANNRRGWAAVRYLRLAADALATLPVSSETSSAPLLAVAAPPSASAPSAAQAPVKGSGSTGLNGRLVISSGNGGLFYLYNLATGELRPIVSGIDPVISPDGQRVAFTRGGGDNGLYVINIDGSNERKLYGGSELLSAPSWSPDNSAIVFSRATGTVQCRSVGFGLCLPDLPLPPPGNDEEPGGPSLSDFPLVTQYIFGLARVKVDDKEYRDLAAVGSATTPDWNEAGILYQAAPGFKITADKPDAEIKTVTLEKLYRDPDWQPNGGRIVFTLREGSHWELFTIDSSGAGLTALTRPATTLVDALPSNVAPVWSPDGQSIVFLSNRTASNEAGAWSVWVMNSDGSNQRRLPIDLTIQYGFAQEQIVSWGR